MALEDIASLEELEAWILGEWVRATVDRRHAFRWPGFTTVDDGRPRARIVVLREFVEAQRELVFFTDVRSSKVAELSAAPAASVLFFDPRRRVQIRVDGAATVLTSGERWEAAFNGLPDVARSDYATVAQPGASRAQQNVARDFDLAAQHFAAVVVTAAAIDWLHLGQSGHRRARIDWSGQPTTREWLTP